jgi:hypothetical protein
MSNAPQHLAHTAMPDKVARALAPEPVITDSDIDAVVIELDERTPGTCDGCGATWEPVHKDSPFRGIGSRQRQHLATCPEVTGQDGD